MQDKGSVRMGSLQFDNHISNALMFPYGDKDKTRARMKMQH